MSLKQILLGTCFYHYDWIYYISFEYIQIYFHTKRCNFCMTKLNGKTKKSKIFTINRYLYIKSSVFKDID